jgi:2-iminobutanoate/2-iminopropanoate deaminase
MTKDVVRTEAAPAPFQEAPYSQAIKANGFVFVSGQLALRPGEKELTGDSITEQTEQVFANLRAILEAAGSSLDRLVKTTVFLQNLADFAGIERDLREARRRAATRALDRRGREASVGRARRDRGGRARLTCPRAAGDRGLRQEP